MNILPGKDGLVHISQIAKERVEKVTDYLSEGQEVRVIVLDVERGRIKLSMKEVPRKKRRPMRLRAEETAQHSDDASATNEASQLKPKRRKRLRALMHLLMRQLTRPRMTVARSNRHKNTGHLG